MAVRKFYPVDGNTKQWAELPAGTYRNTGFLAEVQDSAGEPTEKSGIPLDHNDTITATAKLWVLRDAYHTYTFEDA